MTETTGPESGAENEPLPHNTPYVVKVRGDESGFINDLVRTYTPLSHASKELTYEDMKLHGLHRYPPARIASIRIKEERARRKKNKRRCK